MVDSTPAVQANKSKNVTPQRVSDTRKPRRKKKNGKPEKPRPDFPLFPHATKRWAKKIKGKLYYFGSWDDPDGALAKYVEQKDDLYAGRKPRGKAEGFTVRDLVNLFLTHKKNMLTAGELSPQTFHEYHAVGKLLVDAFADRLASDIAQEDFEALRCDVARKWGPVRLGNTVQRVRSVFKYGHDIGKIEKPRFGPGFKRPSRKTLRLNRAKQGPKMFEAHEIKAMLDAAGVPLKAMILLGINCGFGNADCASLPLKALDLDGGWVNYPRPKTGIDRRCPLWPETVQAIRDALAKRPEPKEEADAEAVFLTKQRRSWHRGGQLVNEGDEWRIRGVDNPVAKETAKLMKALGLNGHRGFYALRHTFETIGGESRDQVAVDHIMGHARDDMASHYRERISDERLKAVTDSVRGWLFGQAGAGTGQ